MLIKSTSIWLYDPAASDHTHYKRYRSEGMILLDVDLYYLFVPYQVYSEELRYGTLLDVMGPIDHKSFVFDYATSKLTSQDKNTRMWIEFPYAVEKVDIADILLWTAQDSSSRFDNMDNSLNNIGFLSSQFGTLQLDARIWSQT